MVKNLPAMQETRLDPWAGKIPCRRKRQPTPVFLPGESHGQRSLAGYSPWGRKETDMTASEHAHMQSEMGSKPEACKDAGQVGTASLAQWGSGPMGLAQAGASNHVPVTTSPDGGGCHAVCGAQVQGAGVRSQTSGSGPRAQGFSTACVHGKMWKFSF